MTLTIRLLTLVMTIACVPLLPHMVSASDVVLRFIDTPWVGSCPGSGKPSTVTPDPQTLAGYAFTLGLSGNVTVENQFGKTTHHWTLPGRIGSQGSPCTLEVEAKAKETSRLAGYISLGGEVDVRDNKAPDITVVAEPGKTARTETTLTLLPRGYSPERTYLELMVKTEDACIYFRYAIEEPGSQGSRLEYDTDRPGQDYHNFTLPEARPELCQAQCGSDQRCKAFTYVKPGVQGPSARCWLKSGVPAAVASSCCTSGVNP